MPYTVRQKFLSIFIGQIHKVDDVFIRKIGMAVSGHDAFRHDAYFLFLGQTVSESGGFHHVDRQSGAAQSEIKFDRFNGSCPSVARNR